MCSWGSKTESRYFLFCFCCLFFFSLRCRRTTLHELPILISKHCKTPWSFIVLTLIYWIFVGSPIHLAPVLTKKTLDLYKFHAALRDRGGEQEVWSQSSKYHHIPFHSDTALIRITYSKSEFSGPLISNFPPPPPPKKKKSVSLIITMSNSTFFSTERCNSRT